MTPEESGNFGEYAYGEKKTERDDARKRALISRLNRIEGQVRGLRGMIEKDAYCPEILIQSSAVAGAVSSFNKALLEDHIRHCVVEDLREGRDETLDELMHVISGMMRT